VVIAELHPESPFAAAGLRVGDVVLAVDDMPVNTPPEMLFRMSVRGVGQGARITYASRGEERQAEVAMIAPPERPARDPVTLGEETVLPGLALERVNPAVAAEAGLPLLAEGVLVRDPGPWGARAGLRAGDLLRAINGQVITAPDEVAPALARAVPRIAVEAERGGRRLLLRFRV
jgi:S1-C subfamily serine protease